MIYCAARLRNGPSFYNQPFGIKHVASKVASRIMNSLWYETKHFVIAKSIESYQKFHRFYLAGARVHLA